MAASRFDYVFVTPVGDLPYFGTDVSLLEGNSVALQFSTIENGSSADLFLDPVPGDLFERASGGCGLCGCVSCVGCVGV